jgi:hypothetical protein
MPASPVSRLPFALASVKTLPAMVAYLVFEKSAHL